MKSVKKEEKEKIKIEDLIEHTDGRVGIVMSLTSAIEYQVKQIYPVLTIVQTWYWQTDQIKLFKGQIVLSND